MRWGVRAACCFCVVWAFAPPAVAADGGELRILTYPIGLVSGELHVQVDLGPTERPAELYLDGVAIRQLNAARTRCSVHLGDDLQVHLLELLRRDAEGRITERAWRWVNRPSQDAELAIRLDRRRRIGACAGRVLWFHALKQNPTVLDVTLDGRRIRVGDDGRSFGFPCPDPKELQLVTASAVFPDGRRAEAVAAAGGLGTRVNAGLTALPVVADGSEGRACDVVSAELDSSLEPTEESGIEVVFVLDPAAGFNSLYGSGWHMSGNVAVKPRSAWRRAELSFYDAEKLWLVTPNARLHRVNGFSMGRSGWLDLLFAAGGVRIEGGPRIADAVAASALVAAAGSRRRVVILLLGDGDGPDGSSYSPEQARAYLAEVGVPLAVVRVGRVRDDGWPAGSTVHFMGALAGVLEEIRNDLDRQCVTWFSDEVHPGRIATGLPEGLSVAGRGRAPRTMTEVWRQAPDVEVRFATAAGPATVETISASWAH